VIRSQDQVNGSFYHHNQSTCRASEPLLNDASGPKLHKDSEQVDIEIPSELIASCVATLTMIQVIRTSKAVHFTISPSSCKINVFLVNCYPLLKSFEQHVFGDVHLFSNGVLAAP
jgi:hypothetical protein